MNQGFETQYEEIEFFRNIKPQDYSKLLYYARLFNIESKSPNGCSKVERKYLVGELGKIQSIINDNLEFYQDYRCNITFLDDRFFVRGKADIRLCLDSVLYKIEILIIFRNDMTCFGIVVGYFCLLIICIKRK